MIQTNMQEQAGSRANPQGQAEVLAWLIQSLESKQPDLKGLIHSAMSFDCIGLDSLARVELVTAMEGQFGILLDPTLAYDFVTPGALAAFVWGELSGTPVDQKQLMGV